MAFKTLRLWFTEHSSKSRQVTEVRSSISLPHVKFSSPFNVLADIILNLEHLSQCIDGPGLECNVCSAFWPGIVAIMGPGVMALYKEIVLLKNANGGPLRIDLIPKNERVARKIKLHFYVEIGTYTPLNAHMTHPSGSLYQNRTY